MEQKSVILEFKDLDTSSRTAVIAHAHFSNIDRAGDISQKGMFDKSWKESKSIDFLFNHIDGETVGNVTNVYEDEQKAYTEVTFGNWTLGNDVIAMAEAKVLKGASFGYETVKKEYKTVNGKKVRVLKEVKHFETSLLTKLPANPLTGIISMKKSLEEKALSDAEKSTLLTIVRNDQSTLEGLIQLSGAAGITDDLYSWLCWNISRRADMMGDIRSQLRSAAYQAGELKSHIEIMEKFTRDTKASDECIKSVLSEIEETKSILSQYDTAYTGLINQPDASRNDNDTFRKNILLTQILSKHGKN
jgi:HK97 family phage prohead protease